VKSESREAEIRSFLLDVFCSAAASPSLFLSLSLFLARATVRRRYCRSQFVFARATAQRPALANYRVIEVLRNLRAARVLLADLSTITRAVRQVTLFDQSEALRYIVQRAIDRMNN